MRNLPDIKKAWKLLEAAEKALGGGPASFYFDELLASYDILMDRFCPFKIGERVILKITPVIEETHGWGWLPWKHVLVKGARGTIVEAECGKGGFGFAVTFDGAEGHHFSFREAYLAHEGEEI